MIWRVSFVAVLFASILVACGNRGEEQPCQPTKNKSLSAVDPITDRQPVEIRQC